MQLYALSDIHGEKKPFEEALENVDLSNPQNKLLLLGDYIDGGFESYEVLYLIKELVNQYGSSVVVLRGNHEEMFLDWLFGSDDLLWLSQDIELKTTKSFLSEKQLKALMLQVGKCCYDDINELAQTYIRNSHKELLSWLKKLPYYYETDKQIFLHAGIDEEAEEMWKHGTSNECFVGKFPPEKGSFYKDIIAGHVSTSTLSSNKDFHEVYWDGKSHYYLDGDVGTSRSIPVLKYNTYTGEYTSFQKKEQSDHNYIWEEYVINRKTKNL